MDLFAKNYKDLPGYPCAWSSPRVAGHEPAHRYTLWRVFTPAPPKRIFCCIGLNPSVATEDLDDPTIRRVISFAKRENCDALVMLNIFAFRSTDPQDMRAASDPIGPENDEWLLRCSSIAAITIAAWGTHGEFEKRGAKVAAMIPNLLCLGMTKGGFPRHPLYVDGSTSLEPYIPKVTTA
ncbi:MAG: DUF1643 domain-containing protein [Geobacter sp.]|nr:MAG: DUF1643 domain-containing protein [Geobacter sp.]